MQISLNWLKEFINIPFSSEELAIKLTGVGLEVEAVEKVEQIKGGLQGVVIGKVLTCEKHPDADKLSITTVDIGGESPSQIVCGAPNVAAGQMVLVATVGCMLYPTSGEPFQIKKAKIRGAVSEGMICAEDEIGLGTSHDGIMVLDTDLKPGTPAAELLKPETDYVYEIGLTPNRADAASHIGVARDVRALSGNPVKWPLTNSFTVETVSLPIQVKIENPEACIRYSAVSIQGVEVKESPLWLKKRLISIGLEPINNIVDVTNYVLHSLGQPLHAFDADAITGKKVIVKTLPKGTKFTTLDEKERILEGHELMICNEEEPMCIGGVFGGLKSGVHDQTKNIFLESATFHPDSIRKTVQSTGLKTDASFRFERGTDPEITIKALQWAAILIKEVAGGIIASEVSDWYPNKVEPFKVECTYDRINGLIGKELSKEIIHEILEALEIRLERINDDKFMAIVPAFKVDVTREADIVEEVLRIYGYDNVEMSEELGTTFLASFPQIDKDKKHLEVGRALAARGFYEIMTNSLTKPQYVEKSKDLASDNDVVILNALSEDLGVMRQTLMFNALEVIAHNINRRQKNVKVFELGKVYYAKNAGYGEGQKLSIAISGEAISESWLQGSRPSSFHDLKSAMEIVLNNFGIKNYVCIPTEKKDYAYGLDIEVNKKVIANIGLVQKSLLKLIDIKQPVFYVEIDWDYLLKYKKPALVAEEISKFPEVRRDLSLVLDKKVTYEEIKDLTRKTERSILKDLNVFDVYEGESLGENKKAYAISFILEDKEKTLTDKVIDKTMSRLMEVFEKQLGAVIRK
jgi:phenylalanyl-tRNA synthetase beta chain